MTVTQLRANIYKVLDEVIETKKPITIDRNGVELEIHIKEPNVAKKRIEDFPYRPGIIVGDPEDLIDSKLHQWDEIDNL